MQTSPSQNYGDEDWKTDVKAVMRATGIEERKTTFLLRDTQLKGSPKFYDDICGILNSGEVSNLWEQEEYNSIVESVRASIEAKFKPNRRTGRRKSAAGEYLC